MLGRATGNEEREAPALDDLTVLVDQVTLFDHEAAVFHRSLDDRFRTAVDRVAERQRSHHLPVDREERDHGERRLRNTPAEAGGETQRQDVRHGADVVDGLARESAEDADVRRGHGHRGCLDDVVEHDVLEIESRPGGDAHADRRSTISSVSPSCTTSPRWLSTVRSRTTTPRSGPDSFFDVTRARTRMVSPILIGALNFHRNPPNATVA